MVGRGANNNRGKGFVLGADAFQIVDEASGLGTVFTCGQPVTHHAVTGDVLGGGEGLNEDSFYIVAHRFDARRQRLFDQIALGKAIDHEGINANHDQNTDQQGGAHAQDQLPLNTASPELHGAPPQRIRG